MAAGVLCRPAVRLRCLSGLRKHMALAQHTHARTKNDDEDKKEALGHQEVTVHAGYKLYYNPSAYHQAPSSFNSQADGDEEERCLAVHAPSTWQQSNRYSISCSRHLSSMKNTLLDLTFNKGPESQKSSVQPYHRTHMPPDVKVDSRAFLKGRTEYASVSHDSTQRPQPVEWDEALSLLQRVSALRGSMKPSNVSSFFSELSRLKSDHMSLLRNDQRFAMLLRYSVEHLCLFTHPQLLDVLQAFVWMDMPSNHSVLEAYEVELSRRADQMTFHQLMFAADLWRCIGKQVPDFLHHLYNSVHPYLNQVGLPEMVHLFYIVGEGRHCPKYLIRPVEKLLIGHLQQLHPEEVGTVCLGLFKSQTSLSEKSLTFIVNKACSEVEKMTDFAMANVLKYLRFSYLYHRQWMEAMVEEVPRRAPGMGVKGLMHVALTCSALHYSNDQIFSAIAERVPSLVPHCRIKDVCKFLWAFGQLGFLPTQSPNFYPSLTEALRQRKAMFQRYPEHLLTGLLGLAFVSQFPEDLIALALSPEFVNQALKNTQLELKKDFFTLNESVALEMPQWKGPRLSSELREEVSEILWKFAQTDVCQKAEVTEAETALQDLLGGEQFVSKRMILPHTRSIDLEVHLNSAGQPIPVNSVTPQSSPDLVPSVQEREFSIGVPITEDLLVQLIKTNNSPHSPPTPSNPKATSLRRLTPDDGERLFHLITKATETLKSSTHNNSNKIVKVAIQVWTRNHYCIQSQQLLGLHAMKIRHLKLAGFRVVELRPQEWFPLLKKSRREKFAYLHCKLYDNL
ncbi:FAST kinase domain-containing protein 5, mitochondrial isoform X2 [Gouania willdenowi]|nr:FAST kinase domain-containing protein 5, mitochondrial isoform X2 [Gouania willdenowi]